MEHTKKPGRWNMAAFTIQNEAKPPFTIRVAGRDRWALEQLILAGNKGCTPIDNPADLLP